MKQRIEYIDFAKGYAIFTIVCYHALQQFALSPLGQKAIVFGGTGVHLFFLLSGFGLAWSSSLESTLDFYRRRMSKVWIPYVWVLSISWVAAMTLNLFPDRWDAWLAGVALFQMFSGHYIESFGGHFWFISAILQFYLAFPLLTRLQRNLSPRLFLLLTFFLSAGWWLIVYATGKSDLRNWNSFFLQFLWEFALGMALAVWMRKNKEGKAVAIHNVLDSNTPYWWVSLPFGLVCTGLMIGMIIKMGEIGRVFNDVPALLGYTALSIFVYQTGRRWIPLLNHFFIWISSFSYSLYLTHVLVLHLCLRMFDVFTLPTLLLYLLLALLAAWVFEKRIVRSV